MAGKSVDSRTPFHSTRLLLDSTIREIVECLESKRIELNSQLDIYQEDYKTKQNEVVADIQQLELLKKHTEGLANNSLSDLQEKVVEDITLKISNLQTQSEPPELRLNFDKNSLFVLINEINIVGYECCSLECDSDEHSDGVTKDGTPKGREKKGKRNKEAKVKKGKKEKDDIWTCECGDKECEFITDEISDKKKKKYKHQRDDRKEEIDGQTGSDGKKDKDKGKKGKEDRKGSQGEGAGQGKKGKNKGKGIISFDAHALIESTDLTESL
ncbi:hypothetical protein LOD99_15813 [Oopsacas minuta]|uniref:Uncharacterized protein n=1 Tax=Oopsacas minuta TaxID=111878 RepID=A0AAV7KB05_9METZ|nr:hypothetical protein LOD99_15813 [Oopsacas minuta]